MDGGLSRSGFHCLGYMWSLSNYSCSLAFLPWDPLVNPSTFADQTGDIEAVAGCGQHSFPPAGQESVAHAVPALPVGRSLVLSEQRERRGHVKPELARTGEAEMVASWFLPETFTLLSASVSHCC